MRGSKVTWSGFWQLEITATDMTAARHAYTIMFFRFIMSFLSINSFDAASRHCDPEIIEMQISPESSDRTLCIMCTNNTTCEGVSVQVGDT